jgi:ketosteroid isomerase-like protein
MKIDLPEVMAEVRAAFESYEKALVSNDVATLDELFRDDPRTVRYGVMENLYGHSEIRSFRAARSPVALGRKLSWTAPGRIGRQTQTWVKFPEGWRVVVGHVSLMEKPAA